MAEDCVGYDLKEMMRWIEIRVDVDLAGVLR
jgi:hypothetical protein